MTDSEKLDKILEKLDALAGIQYRSIEDRARDLVTATMHKPVWSMINTNVR